MEVEDEYKLLQRLFFKKYGRALPEKKSDDVDIEMDPKDLTEEQKKMEAIPSLAPVDFVKKESIKIDDTVKTAVKQVETVDKVACLSLRQTPSEEKSDFKRISSKQTSLLRIEIKSPSDDASQNETSVQNSWRLNSKEFIDSIRAEAKRKSEMKFPNYSSRREWRTLHQRTKEIVNTLIRISEHLERIEMNKTTVEVTRYLNCASRLTKIIPEMLENLTDHFVLEKVSFCESPPKQMVPLPVVVKTEPIEVVAVRKSLRKSDVIPEKEAPEDVIEYHFFQERKNFCESPTDQKEDDKGRKDVADHTAKQFKLTSAGAIRQVLSSWVNISDNLHQCFPILLQWHRIYHTFNSTKLRQDYRKGYPYR
jgi:hypothetical protein